MPTLPFCAIDEVYSDWNFKTPNTLQTQTFPPVQQTSQVTSLSNLNLRPQFHPAKTQESLEKESENPFYKQSDDVYVPNNNGIKTFCPNCQSCIDANDVLQQRIIETNIWPRPRWTPQYPNAYVPFDPFNRYWMNNVPMSQREEFSNLNQSAMGQICRNVRIRNGRIRNGRHKSISGTRRATTLSTQFAGAPSYQAYPPGEEFLRGNEGIGLLTPSLYRLGASLRPMGRSRKQPHDRILQTSIEVRSGFVGKKTLWSGRAHDNLALAHSVLVGFTRMKSTYGPATTSSTIPPRWKFRAAHKPPFYLWRMGSATSP